MQTIKIDLQDVRKAGSVVEAIVAECERESIMLATSAAMGGQTFATSGPGSGWSKTFDASDYASAAIEDDVANSDCNPSESECVDPTDGRVASGVDPDSSEDDFADLRDAEATDESWIFTISTECPNKGKIAWLIKLDNGSFATAWPNDPSSWEDDDGGFSEKRQTTSEEHSIIVSLWNKRELPEPKKFDGEISWTDESCVEVDCPSVEDAMDYPQITAEMARSVVDYHHTESDVNEWSELLSKVRTLTEALEGIEMS